MILELYLADISKQTICLRKKKFLSSMKTILKYIIKNNVKMEENFYVCEISENKQKFFQIFSDPKRRSWKRKIFKQK